MNEDGNALRKRKSAPRDSDSELREGDDDWNGRGFVRRSLRSGWTVGVIVVLVLLSYGQFWAISSFLFGLALSSALLVAWDVFVRLLLSPPKIEIGGDTTSKKRKRRMGTIFVFSLIKYPLVGLLLYVAVRLWRGDSNHALAFLGGFILLHAIIGLRAFGRAFRAGASEIR